MASTTVNPPSLTCPNWCTDHGEIAAAVPSDIRWIHGTSFGGVCVERFVRADGRTLATEAFVDDVAYRAPGREGMSLDEVRRLLADLSAAERLMAKPVRA